MDPSSFIVVKATLLFLATVLIIEYAIRRRKLRRELMQNSQKQQQHAVFSVGLKNNDSRFGHMPITKATGHCYFGYVST